jgi:hypothetical protein
MNFPKIAYENWLQSALDEQLKLINLVKEDKVPEAIEGWMLVVSCRRILRAVYGTDSAALNALQDWHCDENAIHEVLINGGSFQ